MTTITLVMLQYLVHMLFLASLLTGQYHVMVSVEQKGLLVGYKKKKVHACCYGFLLLTWMKIGLSKYGPGY